MAWLAQATGIAAPILAVLAVAFGLYSEEREWVYDDRQNYRDNPRVLELSSSNIQWAFESGVVVGVYEPVANMFKMLFFSIFGSSLRTMLYLNWVLHMLNAYLSFRITNLLVGRVLGAGQESLRELSAFIGSMLMAVHPLRVEVVAWASCVPYTMVSGLLASVVFQPDPYTY
jgi:hypothetical protein